MNHLKALSLYIFFILLAYMPLHILLSTWFGTAFGVLEFAKVAKDILLVVGFALVFIVTPISRITQLIKKSRIIQLIICYGLFTLLLALIKPTDTDAEILGIVYNTRFLLVFLYGVLLAQHYKRAWLLKRSLQIVAAVGGVVLLFGLLQYLFLSDTALTHLGYSRENGVLPAFAIDDKEGLERVMSTLRDPNSYGAFLILLNSLFAAVWLKTSNPAVRKITGGLLALGLLNLLFTFSRSAWIGAVASLGLVVVYLQSEFIRRNKNAIIVTVTALATLVSIGAYTFRNHYYVQNIVFHADESTVLEDPNQLRARFWQESAERAKDNPLGHGPGTAGLASIRNDKQVILNENYYLQLLHEVGVAGLVLFLAIIAAVGRALYGRRSDVYALVLFASLVGISIANLFVHIWSNEAVAYTFWMLASFVIVSESLAAARGKAKRQFQR